MTPCLFASDLHGKVDRYDKLFREVQHSRPAAVFLGGDLLPGLSALAGSFGSDAEFVESFLGESLELLRRCLGKDYPQWFVVLGNDDGKAPEASVLSVAGRGLWSYAHGRRLPLGQYSVYGYAFVPPTPFQLKDWERYDVSRFVDPGCVPPEEGWSSESVSREELRYATIQQDLEDLTGEADLARAVFLFHTPPYRTHLDRADLDGKRIDWVPLDVHVGSIAVRRFLEKRQPLVSLHGHVHESARLNGSWRDRLGRTHCFSAAHDGPELALVRFDLERPERADRRLP